MPNLFIPERYEAGFSKIVLLSEDDFTSLTEGLSLMSLVSSIRVLASKISENKNLDYEDLNEIFESVGSLVAFSELEDKQISKEIVNDLAKGAIQEELIKPENEDVFKTRVQFLLNNQHLYYAYKAENLTSEFGNVYLSSKLSTDIRPIFGSKIEETPVGGIIVHNFHIHYRAYREGHHKDIYLSLDKDDVDSLIDILKRAQKKEISLKQIFNKSGMTNLND